MTERVPSKHGDATKAAILETGLRLWRDGQTVSARNIGKWLGITHAAVLYHFGAVSALHTALACEAVRTRCAVIVPRLIVERHPATDVLTDAERSAWLARC